MNIKLRYLKRINHSKLVEASNRVQEYCINEEIQIAGIKAYHHHFPLKDNRDFYLSEKNWDLPDAAKRKIKKNIKSLDKYAQAVFCVYNYNVLQKSHFFIRELLPPWVVYPHFDAMSAAWRQGDGEYYMEIFIFFLDSLSEKQCKEYFETYPIPEYMKVNSFGFNVMNHYLRTEK